MELDWLSGESVPACESNRGLFNISIYTSTPANIRKSPSYGRGVDSYQSVHIVVRYISVSTSIITARGCARIENRKSGRVHNFCACSHTREHNFFRRYHGSKAKAY